MWTLLGTAIVPLLKFIFEKIAKRKLNDREFLDHIEAHQRRRQNAGKTAMDFEDSLQGAIDGLDNPKDTNHEQK